MTSLENQFDLSTAVQSAAAALAAAFGLGSEIVPTDEWPVDEGDAVITVELGGTAEGLLQLALNEDVAQRLSAAHDVLQQGIRGALAAIQTAAGPELHLEAGQIGTVAAGVPQHIAAVVEQGQMTALVGLSFAMPAAPPPPPAPVAEPVAAAPAAPAPAPAPAAAPAAAPVDNGFQPEHLGRAATSVGHGRPLSVLHDVDLVVTAELGRTTMPVRELLDLSPGMVVEIDRAAGAPIDLLVNGRRIATGEVVVIDEEFGVRITEILAGDAP